MGIPDFYGKFLKERDKKELDHAIQKILPPNIVSLSLDFNSIIHEAAGQVYRYNYGEGSYQQKLFQQNEELSRLKLLIPNAEQYNSVEDLPTVFQMYVEHEKIDFLTLEKELFSLITEKILNICGFVRPQILILAVDGLAPMAKILQQRKRRYGKKTNSFFDSNCITPGTDFMDRLDSWIRGFLFRNKNRLAKKIIYSNYKVEGEGEHKIMNIFRQKDFPKLGNHLIYGLDSDLIVLTMGSELENPYVFRHKQEFISTNVLKKWLLEKYYLKNILDFMVLTFFIGNDFLPRMPNFYNLEFSLTGLLTCYKEVNENIVVKNKINFAVVKKILIMMEKYTSDGMKNSLEVSAETKYDLGDEPVFNLWKKNIDIEMPWHAKSLVFRPDQKSFDLLLNMPVEYLNVKPEIMAVQFLKGVAWCLNYYIGMPIDVFWFYDYNYAPTLKNVLQNIPEKYPNIDTPSITNGNLSIREQLLCVIPPRSINLIPEHYLPYIQGDLAPLEYLFCKNYEGPVVEGFNKIHEAPVILSVPNMEFILKVTGGVVERKYLDSNLYLEGGIASNFRAMKNMNKMLEIRKKFDFSNLKKHIPVETQKRNVRQEFEIDGAYIIPRKMDAFLQLKKHKK